MNFRDADILGRWIIKIDDSDHEKFLQINREARTLRLYDAMLGNAAQFLLQSYFYLTKFKEIDAYLSKYYDKQCTCAILTSNKYESLKYLTEIDCNSQL